MKERVLFVCPLPPPFGGLANNTRLLLNSRLSSLFDIDVLDTSRKIVRIKLHRRGLGNATHLLRLVVGLVICLRRGRHATVYMKSTSDISFFREAIFLVIAKAFGKRTVLHLHANQLRYLFSGRNLLCNLLFSVCLWPADHVIFLSDSLREGFSKMTYWRRSRFEVLNNVVETAAFAGNPDRGRGAGVQVLFVGRLTEEKGFWDILRVAPEILRRHADVRFVFGGVGESIVDEAEIRQYCRESGIEHRLVFLGRIDGAEKISTYLSSDVFLFPSREEIFPNSILEALASGLPIISTRIFCIPEMVEEGVNGFLIEPGDLKALKERLEALIADTTLRQEMRTRNRRRAVEKYDVQVAVRKLRPILSGKRP
jgi:glycosyltransferase involved in cell wall biosynthesis